MQLFDDDFYTLVVDSDENHNNLYSYENSTSHNVSYDRLCKVENSKKTNKTTPKNTANTEQIKPSDFNRIYPPMTLDSWPVYHAVLEKLGLWSISWDVSHCGTDSLRLHCKGNAIHDYHVPVFCKRRTCPECTRRDMIERYTQFFPITQITENVNGEPGERFPEEEKWRVRFVTLTCKAVPGEPLDPVMDIMKKALFRWWRYMYGDKTPEYRYKTVIDVWKGDKLQSHKLRKPIKGHEPEAGGLFFVEVQAGWNIHFHGLVLGPQRDFEYTHKIWKESLEFYQWIGNWIKIDDVYPDENGSYKASVFEILNYPVRPDKSGRHDQELMANVEKSLIKRKRYITKGSWYNKFPRPEREKSKCPICENGMAVIFDRELEKWIGSTFNGNFFSWDETGLENFKTKTRDAIKSGAVK